MVLMAWLWWKNWLGHMFYMVATKFGDNVDESIESAGFSKWKNALFSFWGARDQNTTMTQELIVQLCRKVDDKSSNSNASQMELNRVLWK